MGKSSVLYIFKIVSVLTFLKTVLLIVPINCKNFANLNSTSLENNNNIYYYFINTIHKFTFMGICCNKCQEKCQHQVYNLQLLTLCAALTVWYLMWVVVTDTPSASCTDPTLLLSSSSKSACLYRVIWSNSKHIHAVASVQLYEEMRFINSRRRKIWAFTPQTRKLLTFWRRNYFFKI